MSTTTNNDVRIDGTCEPGFEAVAEAFAENFRSRGDIGAAVSVTVAGSHRRRPVGRRWPRRGGPGSATRSSTCGRRPRAWWRWPPTCSSTAVCSTSTSRWRRTGPSSPRPAKQSIPVRYLLSHRSGLSGAREPLTIDDLPDWDKVTAALAASEPWWEPGTASGYHALTFGYLVGEVIRRSHRPLGRARSSPTRSPRPLGADVTIGLDTSGIERCATLSMDAPPPDSANAAMFAQLDPAVLAALANPSMAAPARRRHRQRRGRGGAPRSPRPTATRRHGRWRRCTRCSPRAAITPAPGCSAPTAAERMREGQGRAVDLVLGVGNAGLPNEWALGRAAVRTGGDLTGRTPAPSGTAATAARSAWPTRRSSCRSAT